MKNPKTGIWSTPAIIFPLRWLAIFLSAWTADYGQAPPNLQGGASFLSTLSLSNNETITAFRSMSSMSIEDLLRLFHLSQRPLVW